MRECLSGALALALLAGLSLVALLRERPEAGDHRVPVVDLEPWMLEALPGIGPKTRDALCGEARSAGPAALPAAARPAALRVIDWRRRDRP